MKILSIETSSQRGSVAYIENSDVRCEYLFKSADIAGELTGKVERVIADSGTAPGGFDRIVVSTGPGSWTGSRLGLSFAKGLAMGDSSRLYVVGAHEGLLFSAKDLGIPVVCAVNAYGGCFYTVRFNVRFNYRRGFRVRRVTREKLFKALSVEELLLVGPGTLDLLEFYGGLPGNVNLSPSLLYPSAGLNGMLACEKMRRAIPSPPALIHYER